MSQAPVASETPIRVAVIGAGAMGANHVRVLSGLPGVIVALVVDADLGRAATLAATVNAAAAQTLDDAPPAVLADLQAAIVATSSSSHAAVALSVLARGLACFIEKPLATTRADCDAIIAAAARAGVPVAVGHVERFNPAFATARALLAAGVPGGETVRAFDAARFNPGSARITDTDVVIDLMVHDIDAVLALLDAGPDSVVAHGVGFGAGVRVGGMADHATAVLGFGPDRIATFAASRIVPDRVRTLRILTSRRLIVVDFLNQAVSVVDGDGATAPPVQRGQSLGLELSRFVAAVRGGSLDAGVGLTDAIRTLDAVWRIQDRIADAHQ